MAETHAVSLRTPGNLQRGFCEVKHNSSAIVSERWRKAIIIFLVMVSLVWFFFFLIWTVAAIRNRKKTHLRESPFSRAINVFLYVIAIVLLLYNWRSVAPLSHRFIPEEFGFSLFGLFIQAAGLGFALWGQSNLGGNWSAQVTLAKDHQLIRTGPYRIVRHPMYLGILLGMFGTAVVIGEIRALLAATAVLIALLWKIKVEEDILRRNFGDTYNRYRREVKMILPFIL